jgi:two-component system, NtrC family, sensor histidine kinase PilS
MRATPPSPPAGARGATRPPIERRRGDRRARERRSATRQDADESWFGTVGTGVDTQWRDEAPAAGVESRFGDARGDPTGMPADSRFMSGQAQRIVGAGQTAFERIYRAFISARAALGTALLLTLGVSGVFGVLPGLPVLLLCIGYAALAISMWLLPRFRRPVLPPSLARLRSPQWLATIGVDIVCFAALHALEPVAGLNYGALLVLPVLMAGVLTPRLMALATAAAVTLVLLGVAWFTGSAGRDATLLLTQAGLAGSGLFVIAVLASELAVRLAREELAARGSLELARQQAQLNRLVIEEMQDGVLVVDRGGRARTANPAARALLAPEGSGDAAPFAMHGVPAWTALVEAIERAFAEAAWPEAGRDVVLDFGAGLTRTLRVRVRFTRRRDVPGSEEFCVLFLEDVRSVQARTRQEKLAAMGRVSAGIAHEIRNPLAAIAQANALLSEDAATAEQRQLTRMVAENVERLKRIVDDVMEVAPGPREEAGVVDAGAQVAAVCGEWTRTTGVGLGGQGMLQVALPAEPLNVVFDHEHLRRVLVNLLDNARRHATGSPASLQLRLHGRDANEALLTLASDGPPISPDVERYLFEPFFSTRSRGSGLGLYICRELCERHGARINFRLRPASERHRNEFSVAMRRQAASAPKLPMSA